MTSFGATTPITSRSLNTAFLQLESLISSPNANSLSGTTLAANVVNSSLTSVGTLVSGSIPATLLTGTVLSIRMSGSYTGITGLGTLTSLTIDGPASTAFTLGDTGFVGYSGITGDKGYLLVGNSVADSKIYLRSSGAGSVNLGASNTNTLVVGNGTATVVGTMNATSFVGPLTGNALTATSATRVSRVDNRTAAPSSFTALHASPLFTSWNNNSGSPFADGIVFRTWSDASGGNDNMLTLRKDALGLRLWQQAFGSATAFATFKDVAWTDGTNATGTWAISTTGNASTATNLSTNRTNWSTNGTISAVVGQLAWKNFGNSHTIFDASNSTSPNGGAVNNTNPAVAWTATYPTLMGWNGSNTFGVRVDSARIADIANSVGTLSALTVSAEMKVTGGAAGYAFYDRGGINEYFVWYSSGADALLYSSRLGVNVMGFARTTGIAYIYKGLNMSNTSIDFADSVNPNANNAGFVGFPFGLYKAWAWVAAYNFHTASDIRYKQNIETLPLGINFLRLIDPIKFTYLYPQFEQGNDTPISVDAGTRPRAGLSAQNVRQALDTLGAGDYNFWCLTNKDNAESMQILDYTGFIAPIIQAIKEIDQRLQQLETV